MKTIFAFFMLISLLGTAPYVAAAADSSGPVCATVVPPCSVDGSGARAQVLDSPCSPQYDRICRRGAEAFCARESHRSASRRENQKLKVKISRLEDQLIRFRRSGAAR